MIRIPIKHSVFHVGVISDTHGLMRPEAVNILTGMDLIIHAGDVGSRKVIDAIETIAPLIAVRGNMDQGFLARSLPETASIEIGSRRIHVLHDLASFDTRRGGFDMVISGHTHQLNITKDAHTTYLNPGSAGPRRLGLPVTLATVEYNDGRFSIEPYNLDLFYPSVNGGDP